MCHCLVCIAGKLAVTGAALNGSLLPKSDKERSTTDESPVVKSQVSLSRHAFASCLLLCLLALHTSTSGHDSARFCFLWFAVKTEGCFLFAAPAAAGVLNIHCKYCVDCLQGKWRMPHCMPTNALAALLCSCCLTCRVSRYFADICNTA